MDKHWTDNRIDDYDTSTKYNSNSDHDVKWRATHGVLDYTPRPVWEVEVKVYCNGKRLRKGEQRPDPLWVDFVDLLLPMYSVIVTKEIFKMKICGAYSRKYGKVRKFRKRRLF